MRSFSTLVMALMCCIEGYSQIDFQKGYYVDSLGSRRDGLIKNVDWENNPTSFTFQQAAGGEMREISFSEASEFGIDGIARFVRATVDVDLSSEVVGKLSSSRAPDFKRQTIFLKVLLAGKASLYEYVGEDVKKYFLEIDKAPVQQLVYKSFVQENGKIGKNLTYRQQLMTALACDEPNLASIQEAEYTQRDLSKLVRQYNSCVNSDVVEFASVQKHDAFNLWLRPRFTLSSLSAERNNPPYERSFQFDQKLSASAGIEMEFILPFNRSKWAITIEPTYQSYNAKIEEEPIRVEYEAIELPIGVRHYFYLNKFSKLSLSAAYQLSFDTGSKVVHLSNIALDISMSSNVALEAGYVFRNRFSFGYRYQLPRELLGLYQIWEAKFSTMAVVVGYSPF